MTVLISKPSINLREALKKSPSGIAGEAVLRSDTEAEAREALSLDNHETLTVSTDGVIADFESTGIDDNATSTKLTVSNTGIDVTGTVTADGLTVESTGATFFNASVDGATGLTTLKSTNNSTGGSLKIQTGGSDRLQISAIGDISFYEDTGTTPAFFWDASTERLGIGTTAPTEILTLGSGGSNYLGIGGDGVNSSGIRFYRGPTTVDGLIEVNDTESLIISIDDTGGLGGRPILFKSGGSETVRIGASGNVGIGTTSPAAQLELSSATGATLRLSRDDTTVVGPNSIGLIEFYTADTDSAGVGASIEGVADGSGGNVALAFSSGTGGSTSEAMRIDSLGNVGIGTTSPTAPLTVIGDAVAGGAGNGSISVTSNTDTNNGADAAPSIGFKAPYATGNAVRILYGQISTEKENTTSGNTRGALVFSTSPLSSTGVVEAMRIDSSGNLLVGGTGTPTSSAGNFVLYNGTAPTGNATDGVILYAEDVSASSELKVRDEAGNVTTLSPHNFDLIPEGPSEDMAWSYYSERDGKRINVDMLKAIRLLEQLSGEKLVHIV